MINSVFQRNFVQIIRLSQSVSRESLEHFFWPNEYKIANRSRHILERNWYEGWYCEFLNQGLLLKVDYFLTTPQKQHWNENPTINPQINTLREETLTEFQLQLPKSILKVRHSCQLAEEMRKFFYISKKFTKYADKIWAAQFFLDDTIESEMEYQLGFLRPLSELDQKIVQELNVELERNGFINKECSLGSN